MSSNKTDGNNTVIQMYMYYPVQGVGMEAY